MRPRTRDWIGETLRGLPPSESAAAKEVLERTSASRDYGAEVDANARYEELRAMTDKQLAAITGFTAARSVMIAAAAMKEVTSSD